MWNNKYESNKMKTDHYTSFLIPNLLMLDLDLYLSQQLPMYYWLKHSNTMSLL